LGDDVADEELPEELTAEVEWVAVEAPVLVLEATVAVETPPVIVETAAVAETELAAEVDDVVPEGHASKYNCSDAVAFEI